MEKIKTWLRIQKRMFLIYLAEIYVAFEWPIRLLINWAFVLSFPLWVGTAFLLSVFHRAYLSRKHVERDVLTGRVWIFDMFRLY